MQSRCLFCICWCYANYAKKFMGLEEYSSRGKDVFPLVTRPTRHTCSDKSVTFHQHMVYSRWMDGVLIWIPVFICYNCGHTVSVLPNFALPYRPHSISTIDEYFSTPANKRSDLANHDCLRHSWYAWKSRWRMVLHMFGGTGCDPPAGWAALRHWKDSLEKAQMTLIGQFGESFLGTYLIHAYAK